MAQHFHDAPFDAATRAKIDLFAQYAESWLPVFLNSGSSNQTIRLFDFFAGQGMDCGGNLGSAMRLIQVINKFEDQIIKSKKKIEVVLNEKDTDVYNRLCSNIDGTLDRALTEYVSIRFENREFSEFFEECHELLKGKDDPSLMFFDQFGFKYITIEVVRKIFSLSKTDFMFFVSSEHLRRFCNQWAALKYFPNVDKIFKDSKRQDVHRLFAQYCNEQLEKLNTGSPRRPPKILYPFSLRKDNGSIYGVIFGTKHPLGVEKFLNIAWNKNVLNGEANYDIDGDSQKSRPTLPGMEDMRQLTKIEDFEVGLEDFILREHEFVLTNWIVYLVCLKYGFHPQMARPVIQRLVDSGKIRCRKNIPLTYKKLCTSSENIEIVRKHHGNNDD